MKFYIEHPTIFIIQTITDDDQFLDSLSNIKSSCQKLIVKIRGMKKIKKNCERSIFVDREGDDVSCSILEFPGYRDTVESSWPNPNVAGWRFIDWGSSACPTLSSANIVHRLALGITDLLPHGQYSRGEGCSSKRTFEQDLVPKVVLFTKINEDNIFEVFEP